MPVSPSSTTRAETLDGLLRVAAVGLVWGTIPLFLRWSDGASVVKVFFRVFVAALGIAAWMALSGRIREVARLDRAKLIQVAIQGVILTVNWVLFLTALDMTNVATAELLCYTGPVFIAVLAPFVSGESFDRRVTLPLALSLGGIVAILAPQGLGVTSPRELIGAGLAFCSALTYAALMLRSKRILAGISGGALMLVEYSVASLLLAPFAAWAFAHGQGPSTARAVGALVTLGLVHTAATGVIFLGALRHVRTDHAAILTYTEPASAVVFAAIFLGEALTWWTLAGGLLVVAGGIAVTRLEPLIQTEVVPVEAVGTTRP